MHELSLAIEVIDLATREADKHKASTILEIEIEVGYLSGVEADTFLSALQLIVKETLLENTLIRLTQTPADGHCLGCHIHFEMKNRMDACPQCGSFPSEITGGQEFRLVAMEVE